MMKIAVTYENGQVFQHFGHCEQFKLYDVQDGQVVSSQVVSAIGSGHGALAEAGIQLYPGVSGDADSKVSDLLAGKLAFDPDTQCSHHHGEDHNCGNHTCGEDKHGCAGNH